MTLFRSENCVDLDSNVYALAHETLPHRTSECFALRIT